MVGGVGVISKVVEFGWLELSLSCKYLESMSNTSELELSSDFEYPLLMESCLRGVIDYRKASTHRCKSLRSLIESKQNQIVFSIFRLIWNQTYVRFLFQINRKMVNRI